MSGPLKHILQLTIHYINCRMFVDDTPIRVLRNLTATVPGYPFPARQTMLICASVWDGSGWATDGGRTKVDWSQGPFTAGYRGFDVSGCASNPTKRIAATDFFMRTAFALMDSGDENALRQSLAMTDTFSRGVAQTEWRRATIA